MNIRGLILPKLGLNPIRVTTKNDDQIDIEILKIDQKANLVLCKLGKVVDSKEVSIESVNSGETKLYRCSITTPQESQIQQLKINSIETEPSEEMVSVPQDLVFLLPSKSTATNQTESQQTLPLACLALSVSKKRVFIKCESNSIDLDELKVAQINVCKDGVWVAELTSKSCKKFTDSILEVELVNSDDLELGCFSYSSEKLMQFTESNIHTMIKNKELIQ